MRLVVTLVGVVCLAAVIVGCGSSSSGSSGDELTKAEYVEQANAICRRAAAKRDADVQEVYKTQQQSGEKVDASFGEDLVLKVALPPLSQMTDDLAALGDPDPGSDEAAEVVEAYEAGITRIEEEPAKILKGTDAFAGARKKAEAFGLKDCAEV